MRINQFRDFPGTSKRAIYPDVSFGNVEAVMIDPGDSYVFFHGISSVVATLPIASLWLTGTKPLFSWNFLTHPVAHPGGVLNVESSYNGSDVQPFRSYYMPPDAVTEMAGLFIPGFAARFTVVNSSPTSSLFIWGSIRQSGVE